MSRRLHNSLYLDITPGFIAPSMRGMSGLTYIRVELAWRSGCVMDCRAAARGSIPGGDGVKTELYVLRKGQ